MIILAGRGYTQNFWQQLNGPPLGALAIAISNSGYIYAGDAGSGIYRSTDSCNTWTEINNGLTNLRIYSLKINSDGVIFAGTDGGGVYRSVDKGDTWVQINNGLTNYTVNSIDIDKHGYIFMCTSGGVFRSTDNGDSWTPRDSGITFSLIHSLAINSTGHLFAATYGGGIFRSTDEGELWTPINNGLTNNKFWTISINSADYIFAGSAGTGLFRSTDNGDNWVHLNFMGPNDHIIRSIVNSSGQIFLIDLGSGVFRSTTLNGDFEMINGGIGNFYVLDALGISYDGYLYTSLYNHFYRSIKSTVVPVELSSFNVSADKNNVNLVWRTATELNNKGFEIERKSAGGEFGKIAFVNGNGTTTETNSYTYTDKDVPNGKYSYRLKQIDFDGESSFSKAIEVKIDLAKKFILEQNYPNPFNPSTSIKFDLPKTSQVKLFIYDILGNAVETLVNSQLTGGRYSIEWNAAEFPSGVYFYKLETPDYTRTNKMILVK